MNTSILRALGDGPGTVDELADRVGVHPALIRQCVCALVYADRLVSCDSQGRYLLGAPPDSWPHIPKAHP